VLSAARFLLFWRGSRSCDCASERLRHAQWTEGRSNSKMASELQIEPNRTNAPDPKPQRGLVPAKAQSAVGSYDPGIQLGQLKKKGMTNFGGIRCCPDSKNQSKNRSKASTWSS
jgi:hypothetical protein